MFAYLVLLLLPSMFAVLNHQQISRQLWVMTIVYFAVFVGLRYEVAPDWSGYILLHEYVRTLSFSEVFLRAEPLSFALFWISEHAGLEVYLSNLVAAVILLIGIFSFARTTPNPWIAVVAATPYLIIVIGMSGIRQAMAAGIVLYLLSRWDDMRQLKRIGYILTASLFHTSALVNSVFLVTQLNIRLLYKFLLSTVILLATLYFAMEVPTFSDNIIKYQQRYINNPDDPESLGALFHLGLILIPAALGFMFKRSVNEHTRHPRLFSFGIYASVFLLTIHFVDIFSSTLSSRLTIYMYFLPMIVYPALVEAFGRRGKLLMIFVVLGFHIAVLLTWFSFGNHAYSYAPYSNVLFE